MRLRCCYFSGPLLFTLFSAAPAQRAQAPPKPPSNVLLPPTSSLLPQQRARMPGMSYQRETPPILERFSLRHLQGEAVDEENMPIPRVALGLYTDTAPHTLVGFAITGMNGKFDFGGGIAPGNYRLIATYPGLCTANVPVDFEPRKGNKHPLRLRMAFPELDTCSTATQKK